MRKFEADGVLAEYAGIFVAHVIYLPVVGPPSCK
jgi:hypothetical protein